MIADLNTETVQGEEAPATLPQPLLSWGVPLLTIIAVTALLVVLHRLNRKASKLIEKVSNPVVDAIPQDKKLRVKELLSQIAIVCDADRVSLGLFHNGKADFIGPKYRKMFVLESYSAPGVSTLPELREDIPLDVLMRELTPLLRGAGELELHVNEAPQGCTQYMTSRGVRKLWNRLLFRDTTSVAVLSTHWCTGRSIEPVPRGDSREGFKLCSLIAELEKILESLTPEGRE